jgi:hypothetical protein
VNWGGGALPFPRIIIIICDFLGCPGVQYFKVHVEVVRGCGHTLIRPGGILVEGDDSIPTSSRVRWISARTIRNLPEQATCSQIRGTCQ